MSEPGAVTASPIAGTVVRFRAEGTTLGSEYRINVLRANPSGTYTETAVSPAAISAGEPTETFAADLPIAIGEYVALSFPSGAGLSLLESPGLTEGTLLGTAARVGRRSGPGRARPAGRRVRLRRRSRTVDAFDGTADVVVPSASSSPPASTGGGGSGPSPVGLGTPPGSTVGAPQCVVPRLGAKHLAAARKMLIGAHCRLGKVRGRRTHSALVVSQSPQTGTRLAAGAKVAVTLRTPPGANQGGKR